ncbi:hypothetical protein CONLIGDRAFT_190023 [Coniochaeta ligniaria NRRL 30616]|uniref:Uncharacterized protein n=1 Tax=Coniochaeta ligniaria NRRL 30616 TaxID=1408157 RepID=A0A1J7J1V0_9PEZI|nr:hypothetical protein CONLIGDRAFT_190023 [Coniochaeta ligniaria NRRL 30616]
MRERNAKCTAFRGKSRYYGCKVIMNPRRSRMKKSAVSCLRSSCSSLLTSKESSESRRKGVALKIIYNNKGGYMSVAVGYRGKFARRMSFRSDGWTRRFQRPVLHGSFPGPSWSETQWSFGLEEPATVVKNTKRHKCEHKSNDARESRCK